MTDLKQLARDIFRDTLAGVDIPRTLACKLRRDGSRISIDGVTIDLAAYDSIRAVAMGKAATAIARGLVACLPDVTIEGVLAARRPRRSPRLPRHRRWASGARRGQLRRRVRDSRPARRRR
jgi:glycerate-2-kinase